MMTQSHIFRMKARSYSKDTSANRNRPFVKAKLISEVEAKHRRLVTYPKLLFYFYFFINLATFGFVRECGNLGV